VVAAARTLREGKIKTARVFTYGMPRVGNAAFVSRYAALAPTTYRFVHGLDIIPSVPPEKLDFRHVGQEFHCASGGKFAVDSEQPAGGAGTSASRGGFFRGFVESVSRLVSPPASPSFRNDTLGRLYEFLPAGIGDHLPDRYYHALGEGER
jgi:triacylglycerol lipase